MIPTAARFHEAFTILQRVDIRDDLGGRNRDFWPIMTDVRGRFVGRQPPNDTLFADKIMTTRQATIMLNAFDAAGLLEEHRIQSVSDGRFWDIQSITEQDSVLMVQVKDVKQP